MWIYAFVSVTVISIVGVVCVAIVPVLDAFCFSYLFQFLTALALGTLCGDALIHLIPHVMASFSRLYVKCPSKNQTKKKVVLNFTSISIKIDKLSQLLVCYLVQRHIKYTYFMKPSSYRFISNKISHRFMSLVKLWVLKSLFWWDSPKFSTFLNAKCANHSNVLGKVYRKWRLFLHVRRVFCLNGIFIRKKLNDSIQIIFFKYRSV